MLKEGHKDSDVRYKNPYEYAKYVKKHFECMKADGYRSEEHTSELQSQR